MHCRRLFQSTAEVQKSSRRFVGFGHHGWQCQTKVCYNAECVFQLQEVTSVWWSNTFTILWIINIVIQFGDTSNWIVDVICYIQRVHNWWTYEYYMKPIFFLFAWQLIHVNCKCMSLFYFCYRPRPSWRGEESDSRLVDFWQIFTVCFVVF